MTRFFAGVLSVIAVTLMLIAYGLLKPGAAAYAPDVYMPGTYPTGYVQGAHQGAYYPGVYPAGHAAGAQAPGVVYLAPGTTLTGAGVPMTTVPQATLPVMAVPAAAPPAQVVEIRTAEPARQVVRSAPSRPSRNWTKTALIIGGSTAAGAGIGGIFGGKKGALIGAAIGGGASSIQQATR